MSTTTPQQLGNSATKPTSGRWIISAWADQTLIIFTPLFSAIVIFFLSSRWVGVTADTIGLIVTSFFALGHHLPGMIRAYGDRDVFDRFRWRFVLVPPILFAFFFPLYTYHFNAFRLITIGWATWHGLMQLYGFARIYDAKVGSTSSATSYWDWMLCLSWFLTAQITSPKMMATLLDHWYGIGGVLIPPVVVQGFQTGSVAVSIAILIGYVANSVLQVAKGEYPSPIKFLMLASGIGFWWFATVWVENIVLGIALFDISHDVQYMAITWLYNCRRVNSSPNIGRFMRFLFRRGMVLLYIGLIVSYGAIGLVPSLVQNETIKTIFTGFLWTSTILHYYMDGFIWKVRESSTRASLGLSAGTAGAPAPQFYGSGLAHFLKWSPLVAFVGWLFVAGVDHSSITLARANELERQFTEQMSNTSVLPADDQEKSWLYSRFQRMQYLAEAIPTNQPLQTRWGIMLANFGQLDKARAIFEKRIISDPENSEGYLMLAGIELKKANLAEAQRLFEQALQHAATTEERMKATIGIGEVYLLLNQPDLARIKFDEALKLKPKLETYIKSLQNKQGKPKSTSEL